MKCLLQATLLLILILLFGCTYDSEESITNKVFFDVEGFTRELEENPPKGSILGQIVVKPNNENINYSLISEEPIGAFDVNNSGIVIVNDSALFDYESNPLLIGKIGISHQSLLDSVDFRVQLLDVEEEFKGDLTVSDFSIRLAENPIRGLLIGRIDARSDLPISFSLISEKPIGAVQVDPSGNIYVKDSSLFDFELNPLILASVQVSDPIREVIVEIQIELSDLNEEGCNADIWEGATLVFEKSAGSDPSLEINQDRITDLIWLTRANFGGELYNAKIESSPTQNVSPLGTEWAEGSIENVCNLTFQSFRQTTLPREVIGKNLVLHLIEEDVYLSLRVTKWTNGGKQGNSGGFAYERSTKN